MWQTDRQNYDSQDRPRMCSRGKNGGLDQYCAELFEQWQFGTAGVEGVNWGPTFKGMGGEGKEGDRRGGNESINIPYGNSCLHAWPCGAVECGQFVSLAGWRKCCLNQALAFLCLFCVYKLLVVWHCCLGFLLLLGCCLISFTITDWVVSWDECRVGCNNRVHSVCWP